ncbi:N-acetylmuramoyl-L-alanine amidase family protein [Senegalia massiliensis]|uniref:N-acetylmuramoyl-L-alanine amidase n=1 Tax=Senegalia massiliensis TaxID=1720316 RepID=A0A845R0G4_9CLOT|nr:N-acetylmuramoyl-L-alanine amidase [Senegalia massiliensis]NBI07489.1 N-acetylmuramoyl-L-alanine amidase [Senegalia massiliensis]
MNKKNNIINKRKQKVRRVRVIFLTLALIFMFILLIFGKNKLNSYLDTSFTEAQGISEDRIPSLDEEVKGPLSGKKIIVDAGHGGSDPGTIGPRTEVQEADLSLKISYILEGKLKELGATVIMTRTEQITEQLGTDTKLKIEDRGKVIEDANADMLISIHQNFNEYSSEIKGTQILVRKQGSLDFATSLQKAFNQELGVNLKYILEEYHVLKYGDQPSVIVETGFFSNSQDEIRLQEDEYQERLINVLCDEIKEYFDTIEKK